VALWGLSPLLPPSPRDGVGQGRCGVPGSWDGGGKKGGAGWMCGTLRGGLPRAVQRAPDVREGIPQYLTLASILKWALRASHVRSPSRSGPAPGSAPGSRVQARRLLPGRGRSRGGEGARGMLDVETHPHCQVAPTTDHRQLSAAPTTGHRSTSAWPHVVGPSPCCCPPSGSRRWGVVGDLDVLPFELCRPGPGSWVRWTSSRLSCWTPSRQRARPTGLT
jgi:hypothetical protein